MSSEKSISIRKQRNIAKIINAIKIFLFGDKIRRKNIENSIDKLKNENEYLKQLDENNKIVQASVMTNNKRITALKYMKTVNKSKVKNNRIVVE